MKKSQIIRFFSAALALMLCAAAFAEEMPSLEPEQRLRPSHGDDALYRQEIDPDGIVSYAKPGELNVKVSLFDGNRRSLKNYTREEPLSFGGSNEYSAAVEGVTTFRGSNYRDGAAWGTITENPSKMQTRWYTKIGGLDKWNGVGWTGQCSIVRWPSETVQIMNIYPEKKAKGSLTEVIYAALDGKIHFFDLDDGEKTRDSIKIGAPIKGSLTVDPRGWPLLYCGQGIDEVNGKSVKIGTRIFSLINGEMLYFLNGRDKDAQRHWYAFDSSPLVDGATDTLFQVGENGIFYTLRLNTKYDPQAGTISIDPKTVKYVYTSSISKKKLGTENSLAIYNHYAYFADNSGMLQCVDINTMKCIWANNVKDDTDSSCVIEVEDDGLVALYTANEVDKRGRKADCNMRKFNALTGEQLWCVDEFVNNGGDENGGGAFATPAVGKQQLSDLVYFHIARTTKDGGTLLAINKATGETVWRRSLKCYGWSSPTCVYTPSGKGYVIVGSSSGWMRLIDGLTGELVADLDLKANIEGSPTVFDSTFVVGTRGRLIVAVDIK